MKPSYFYCLAYSLVFVDSLAAASTEHFDWRGFSPFAGLRSAAPHSLFNYLACHISARIKYNLNPIGYQTYGDNCSQLASGPKETGTQPTSPSKSESTYSSTPTITTPTSGITTTITTTTTTTSTITIPDPETGAKSKAIPVAAKTRMFAHIDKRQIMPSFSGVGTLRGDIVLGGGVLPTLSVGGMFNGGEKGIGAGASATVNLGGAVLPKVTAGGGAYGNISQNVLGGGVSGTFVEGGWLGGIVPPANGGASLGGQFGVKYSSGLHVLAGNNGAGWGTITYGGFLIPASTVAVNVGGNRGVLIDNTMFVTPTPTPAPTP